MKRAGFLPSKDIQPTRGKKEHTNRHAKNIFTIGQINWYGSLGEQIFIQFRDSHKDRSETQANRVTLLDFTKVAGGER